MNNKLIAKSKRSIYNLSLVLLGIVMLLFFIYLLDINFQPINEYEENLKPIAFALLILLIIYCLYYLLNQKRFYVYDKYFEIKVLFKTEKYFYTAIKTYYSEYFKEKHNSWTEHYLVLNTDEKITLVEEEYTNFHDFFYPIKIRVKTNKKLNSVLKQPNYLNYTIICGFISVVLFYFSSCFYNFQPIVDDDFSYVKTVLQNDVTRVTTKASKKQIEIKVIEQKDFNFIIRRSSYEAISDHNTLYELLKKGHKIAIGIKKQDFDKKISKRKKLTFLDKYYNFKSITVHQIKDATGKSSIDLEKINRRKIESNYLSIGLLSLFGLLFSYLTFGNYKAYIKAKK
jgi:hypothetical protein